MLERAAQSAETRPTATVAILSERQTSATVLPFTRERSNWVRTQGLYAGPMADAVLPGPEAAGIVRDHHIARLLDLVIAVLALIFLLPVMILIGLLITAHDGGPPIFAHRRIGLGGRSFPCLKFRSMVVNADEVLHRLIERDPAAAAQWARDHKLRPDPRITRLGNFLRRSSLDELPQLLNVIRGDMSLVGPRPIVDAETKRYGRYFRDYCSVKPGLTGLWQISGRNDTTYRRRVAMDVVYTRCASVRLNVRILLATVPAVLTRRGSY